MASTNLTQTPLRRHPSISALRTLAIPGLPPSRPEINPGVFVVGYEGEFSKFEVRQGSLHCLEVRETLKGGLRNLKFAFDEINHAIWQNPPAYLNSNFMVYQSGNRYPKIPDNTEVVISYFPVIPNSGNRIRLGSDPQISHEGLLQSLKLEFVPNDLHRLACGAMRIFRGFPDDPIHFTSSYFIDSGDLNHGKVIRTESGSASGLVASYVSGIRTNDWRDNISDPNLCVAGMSYRNYD